MGATFSTRLRVWMEAHKSANDEWTPKRFEDATGVPRVYWSYWVRADARAAAGEKVVDCHKSPTIKQLSQNILPGMAKWPDFVQLFAAPRPQPLEIITRSHHCLYCGETIIGHDKYCNDLCYAYAKVKQRQDARRKHAAERQATG